MKPVLLAVISLMLTAFAGGAAANCITDTSQADFQTGTTANSVDTASSPDNVVLARTGGGGATLDQQNTSFTHSGEKFNNVQWVAQSFTAGASGSLSRVDVNVFNNCSATPPPITVSIRTASGGLPTGSDLPATGSFTITAAPGSQAWYSANFSTPATVSAGAQYAIVLRASGTVGSACLGFSDSAVSSSQGNDVYSGGFVSFLSGSTWTKETGPTPSVDGGFKTYIGGSASGYVSAGDLASSVKDSNPGTGIPNWTTLSWTNAVPSGTSMRFQAAASNNSTGPFNFVGPDGTVASYFTTTNSSLSQFNGNRYLKYRAFLSTSTSSSTPTLNDATACYTVSTPQTSSDVAIRVSDASGSVVPGTTVTYTVTASNAGPDAVSRATVSDAFPAPLTSCHWTCAGANGGSCQSVGNGNIGDNTVNLPVGATATYTATCTLPTSAIGTLVNTATIADPTGATDPNTANNSSTDTDTITPQADLSVTINDGQTGTTAGATGITYTILAQNPGPSDAPSSTVADNFPSTLTCTWTCAGTNGGTCPSSGSGDISATVGLPKGGRTTFTAICSLASSATGNLVNTATVTPAAGVTDTSTANNSATDSDSIAIRPDVAITLTDNTDFVQVGEQIDYVITVTNAGPSDAAVNVTDSLPAQLGGNGVSWGCSAAGGASCSNKQGNGTSMNTNATVPVGGVVTYTYTATVLSDDASNSFYNGAFAHVTNGSDPNGGNNVATDTDRIVIFISDFSSDSVQQAVPSSGGASMTVDLGVDAGLLNTLGPAPVTVATALSASGNKLFSLQLMRAGGDVLMRSLTPIDGSRFSDVAPWQVVDLGQHRIGFEWHAATTRGDDGILRAGSATQQALMAVNNSREMPAHLQIATVNNIPWLVLVEP